MSKNPKAANQQSAQKKTESCTHQHGATSSNQNGMNSSNQNGMNSSNCR